jgi:HEAT repeat protein
MLSPQAPALPALARRDHGRFLRLWTYLHESVRGDASERLNRTALHLSIDRSARHFLQRGSRAQQLQAILAAGYLKDRSAWDALQAMARSSDGLVSVNAARALIRIDALAGAQFLMPLILARQDWDVTRVAAFLVDAREAFWLLLIKSLPALEPTDLPRGLALAEALRLQLPEPTLRYLLDPERPPEVIGSALRLAAAVALAPQVRALLAHPAPDVRQQAALALARLGGPDDVARLAALLQDGQWPVRLGAAQALAALPFLPTAQLVALQREGGGANDVLRHVIAERDWR